MWFLSDRILFSENSLTRYLLDLKNRRSKFCSSNLEATLFVRHKPDVFDFRGCFYCFSYFYGGILYNKDFHVIFDLALFGSQLYQVAPFGSENHKLKKTDKQSTIRTYLYFHIQRSDFLG